MKHRSRSALVTAFTIALTALALPAAARADRVVLYSLGGSADEDRIDELEERIAATIRALNHDVIAPPGGLGATRPTTAAQMEGVAMASSATYVVLAEIEPLRGQYRLHIRVGYAPTQRVEELVVTVLTAEEQARLRDVFRSMLRPDGLGDDAVRLTGDGTPQGESEADRLRREEEERARLAAEEAERQRLADEAAALAASEAERAAEEARRAAEEAAREAETRAEREREAWNARATYGSDGEWLVMLGGAGSYLGSFQSRTVTIRNADGTESTRTFGQGGGLGLIQARVGHAFSGTDGLELRGGIDVVLGAIGGLDIVVGGVWQFTPFADLPIHFGPTLELGASFTFTGGQSAGFLVRAGAVASWTPTRQLQIELALPEIGVMTNGPGAFVIGAALRAGYRF